MEERFWEAVSENNEEEVEEIIRSNPSLDVNWENGHRCCWTALHLAGEKGYDAIVSMLLVHPNINVNAPDENNNTPFLAACFGGHATSVRLLLRDLRVKVNELNEVGHTPLWWTCRTGRLDVIKWWIASGREIDLGEPGDICTDAIGVAKMKNEMEVVALLERFKESSEETRHAVRVELGWYDDLAAGIFALVVFISDGLLQINGTATTAPARFFRVAAQLPLELQMLLCYRSVGLAKEIISTMRSEEAFKAVARNT